jgi:hypothetical protein
MGAVRQKLGATFLSSMTESALRSIFYRLLPNYSDCSQLLSDCSQLLSNCSQLLFDCSQLIWEQSGIQLTAPNFCLTAPNFCLTAPNFCLTAPNFCLTAPNYFGSSQITTSKCWDLSLRIGRSRFFGNDRQCTKNPFLPTAPKIFGSSHVFI